MKPAEPAEAEEEDRISQVLRSELPICEIFAGLSDDGKPPTKHYRIYYNGRVEGFDERIGIVNYCPSVHATLSSRALQTDTPHPLPNATIQPETVQGKDVRDIRELVQCRDEMPAA